LQKFVKERQGKVLPMPINRLERNCWKLKNPFHGRSETWVYLPMR
jgi:hypothetical protein